jgi:hypothetical protein
MSQDATQRRVTTTLMVRRELIKKFTAEQIVNKQF